MKILFCTDGSNISFNAIKNFVSWSKDLVIDVLCVIDWSFLPDSVPIENSEFAAQCTNSADSILNSVEKKLLAYDIKVGDKLKLCGSVVDSILDVCQKSKYDFIVLGSHGKKGVQKWLGSVSQEVASAVDIPVYISKQANEQKNVLFTVDSSEISDAVVDNAISAFNFENRNIYLVTVYEIPDFLFLEGNINSDWMLDIQKKQETASRLLLNRFERVFQSYGLNISDKTILQGAPANEIIKFSKQKNIDLIICGNKNHKYLSRFLLGSVSLRVLENAESDVLIFKNVIGNN